MKYAPSIAKFYNTFAFLYPVIDLALTPQKRVLMKEINDLPNGALLEIGVGTGSHLNHYKAHKVVGIDVSCSMLALAEKNKRKDIQLLQMDGQHLSFKRSTFDYVVLSHVIAVAENPEQLIKEVHRVLKPDGILLVLNHFTPDNWLKHADKIFDRISRVLKFRSLFSTDHISGLKSFKTIKKTDLGYFSYFKLIVFQKIEN